VFFAALASLAVLAEAIYSDLNKLFQSTSYTQGGILGATFFATAFLGHVLARRIRASESLARQRGLHVQYLAQLNEQIVRHIQSGIIVIDGFGQIRLCNEAASRLLGTVRPAANALLSKTAPQLTGLLEQWRRNPENTNLLFHPENGEVDLIAGFTRLTGDGAGIHAGNLLIMLEDATLTTRRAEQLKLTALGRLTASIAHEIRNPLGAISHAAQLLRESPNLTPGDSRLSQIVVDHCQRVNGIVENVLQLSRQRDAQSVFFDLIEWLHRFIDELADYYGLEANRFRLASPSRQLIIGFDPDQLQQVAWNLCENALRYSQGPILLEFSAGIGEESGRPFLDIRDHGPGISDELAGQVFEPFFTTEKQGSGLGLYIAQGICAINRASLHLLAHGPGGCVFRISFSEPNQEAVSA
jgi:two-component system sensor histidine kinase PilS (NtrC family)